MADATTTATAASIAAAPGTPGTPGTPGGPTAAAAALPPQPQLSLSFAETQAYAQLYLEAGPDAQGRVGPTAAIAFMTRSGLSQAQLHHVWQRSDDGAKGYLTKAEFFTALRYIALAQQGKPLTDTGLAHAGVALPTFGRPGIVLDGAADEETPLAASSSAAATAAAAAAAPVRTDTPTLDLLDIGPSAPPLATSLPPPALPASAAPTTLPLPPVAAHATGPAAALVATEAEKLTYQREFLECRARNAHDPIHDHKISGDAGREVWLRTHVPPDQLFLVWGISDTQSCGRLSFQEFSAGRLVIDRLAAKRLPAVPAALAPAVFAQFDRLAAAMDAAPVSTPTTTAPPGAAPGTAGGSGLATPLTGVGAMAGLPPPASATAAMPRGPISAHTTGDGGVLPNLVILPADRVKYGKLFDKLDADNKGYVPGADAHAFLTRSKLSSMVLGQIWELSDTKKLGSLDRNQFIVLMHLVAERMAGRPLPASVPPEVFVGAPLPGAAPGTGIVPGPPPTGLPPSSASFMLTPQPASASTAAPTVPPSTAAAAAAAGGGTTATPGTSMGDLLNLSTTASPSPALASSTFALPPRSRDLSAASSFKDLAATGGFPSTTTASVLGGTASPGAGLPPAAVRTPSTDPGAGAGMGGAASGLQARELDLAGRKRELADAEAAFAALQPEEAGLRERRDQIQAELRTVTAQRNAVQQQLAQLRVVFQTAKHDVQDLEEQLTQERQAYEQDQRHLQLAETGVLALQSEKTALQEQLAQNETRAQTLKKSIGEYTDFSVGLKEEVAKLREELRKTLQLVDVAQQQVASAESEYKALKDDVADLTERRENQRKRSEALQSQLSVQQAMLDRERLLFAKDKEQHERDVADYTKRAADQTALEAQLTDARADMQRERDAMAAQRAQHAAAAQERQRQQQQQQQQIEAARAQMAQERQQLAQLSTAATSPSMALSPASQAVAAAAAMALPTSAGAAGVPSPSSLASPSPTSPPPPSTHNKPARQETVGSVDGMMGAFASQYPPLATTATTGATASPTSMPLPMSPPTMGLSAGDRSHVGLARPLHQDPLAQRFDMGVFASESSEPVGFASSESASVRSSARRAKMKRLNMDAAFSDAFATPPAAVAAAATSTSTAAAAARPSSAAAVTPKTAMDSFSFDTSFDAFGPTSRVVSPAAPAPAPATDAFPESFDARAAASPASVAATAPPTTTTAAAAAPAPAAPADALDTIFGPSSDAPMLTARDMTSTNPAFDAAFESHFPPVAAATAGPALPSRAVAAEAPAGATTTAATGSRPPPQVQAIIDMGFSEDQAKAALAKYDFDVQRALNSLLDA